jgi:hypothetical protein
VSLVDLERTDRAHIQVGKISCHFTVNPVLNFTVIVSRRVRFDHEFVAIPVVPLRDEQRIRLEIGVLVGIGEPIALSSSGRFPRQHVTVRIPVVPISFALLRPVSIYIGVTGSDFSGSACLAVLQKEEKKSCAVCRWFVASRLRIFRRESDAIVIRSLDIIVRVELLVHPHEHRVLLRA